MSNSLKLNIFQRGILQKAVAVVAYLGSIAVGAFILDWADKRLFTNSIKEAERQGVITPEALLRIQTLIETRDNTVIFAIILIGLFCVLMGWFLMRWAAKLNWSWPVTIPHAIEFRAAMEQLGITNPDERIDFVRKHKLPIFIALSPLTRKRQESVPAQLYAFAHHSPLGNSDIFERHIGKQTLCLDADQYDALAKKIDESESHSKSVIISEKNEEIKGLNAALASVAQEKETLIKERDELRDKVRIQPAQEDTRVDRLRVEHLLWSGYIPVIERLLREAPEGKKYITKDIETEFNTEWEHRPDLRERMKELTGSEEASPSESFMKAVKAEFKAQGKFSSGGRPTKKP